MVSGVTDKRDRSLAEWLTGADGGRLRGRGDAGIGGGAQGHTGRQAARHADPGAAHYLGQG